MTITARYAGTCRKCGGQIRPGEQIDWNKSTRETSHAACGGAAAQAPVTKSAPVPAPEGGKTMNFSRQVTVGQAVTDSKTGTVYIVLSVRYYAPNEDVDEFDPRWSAMCRPATEAEAAPVLERRRQADAKRAAQARVRELANQVQTTATNRSDLTDRPAPDGAETLLSVKIDNYGHHRTYYLAQGQIMLQSCEYDMPTYWWAVPATDELVAELRTLAETLQ